MQLNHALREHLESLVREHETKAAAYRLVLTELTEHVHARAVAALPGKLRQATRGAEAPTASDTPPPADAIRAVLSDQPIRLKALRAAMVARFGPDADWHPTTLTKVIRAMPDVEKLGSASSSRYRRVVTGTARVSVAPPRKRDASPRNLGDVLVKTLRAHDGEMSLADLAAAVNAKTGNGLTGIANYVKNGLVKRLKHRDGSTRAYALGKASQNGTGAEA